MADQETGSGFQVAPDEEYQVNDGVLGHLNLPDPCPIRVVVTNSDVKLYVGPRDYAWDRRSGELWASGTDVTDREIAGVTISPSGPTNANA